MSRVVTTIDETFVCEMARERLKEIEKIIQMARYQGFDSDDMKFAAHLISIAELHFTDMKNNKNSN